VRGLAGFAIMKYGDEEAHLLLLVGRRAQAAARRRLRAGVVLEATARTRAWV